MIYVSQKVITITKTTKRETITHWKLQIAAAATHKKHVANNNLLFGLYAYEREKTNKISIGKIECENVF